MFNFTDIKQGFENLVDDPIQTMGLDDFDLTEKVKDNETTRYGRDNERTTKTGKKRGQVGVGNVETNGKGVHTEFGGFNGNLNDEFSGQLLYGEGSVGKQENQFGQQCYGLDGQLNTVTIEKQPTKNRPFGFKGQGPSVNGRVRGNKKGVDVNFGGNLVNGELTVGHKGKEQVNFGMGIGLSGGVTGGKYRNEDGEKVWHGKVDCSFFSLGGQFRPKKVKEKGKNLVKKGKKKLDKLGTKVGYQVNKGISKFGNFLDDTFFDGGGNTGTVGDTENQNNENNQE